MLPLQLRWHYTNTAANTARIAVWPLELRSYDWVEAGKCGEFWDLVEDLESWLGLSSSSG
jgi:hypothetical protein